MVTIHKKNHHTLITLPCGIVLKYRHSELSELERGGRKGQWVGIVEGEVESAG